MKLFTAVLYIGLLSCSAVHAEVLRIPISQQGDSSIKVPSYGERQAQVLEQFGEPRARHASVGQPPITRWDYPNFSVYFERTTVINSVQTHQPGTERTP